MSETLRDTLYNFQIEWPRDQNRYFVPVDALDSLITYGNAKKIFAILLYIERIESIFNLIDDGIADQDLPFMRCHNSMATNGPSRLRRRNDKCHQTAYHRDCGIQEITRWSQRAISDFSRDQWLVQAPVFQKLEDGSIPHYDLNDNTILPFIQDNELQSNQKVSSGYSHVWGVRIHPAHQNLYRVTDAYENVPLLAIKRPFSTDPLDFKRETDMLSALAVGNHPNLIRLLATYKFKAHYHLIFPHAAFNLRSYWDETGLPYWNRETFLWSLIQLRGIASGLHAIHNFRTKVPLGSQPANQTLQIPSGGKLKVAESEEKFGRHGDIKPENILWFGELEGVSGESVLQIADMGLGRFHRLDSRSKVDPRGISGSPTYSPPEIALDLPVSRAYDIWSLGCVFLEFITWMLEGGLNIYSFSSARTLTVSPGFTDDTFYTEFTDDNGKRYAEVREGVKTWINRLKRTARCSQMVGCLLDLVQDRMLVIDSKNRISADKLVSQLTQFLDRARKDDAYLLGLNRPDSRQSAGMKKPQQDSRHISSTANHLPDHSVHNEADQLPIESPATLVSPSFQIDEY